MQKKLMSLLCLMLVLAFGFGGIVQADADAAAYSKNEQGYPDLEGQTISVWQRNFRTDVAENYSEFENVQTMQELFNVKIDFVHPPVGQEAENFSIMMASAKLPDMIFSSGIDEYYSGGLGSAYNDGILYDYTDLVTEENAPNFLEIISENEYLDKISRDDEGRIVRLGAKLQGSEESDFTYEGLFLRKDYLDEAGLEVPETIDEWTAVLEAFKDQGIEYPLGLSTGKTTSIFAMPYGIDATTFNVVDGEVVFGPYTQAFKDYLTQMNAWFSAGYINPDYMSTADADMVSMIANDRVGSSFLHAWNYKTIYYPTIEETTPEKGLVPAQYPVLNEGDALPNFRRSGQNIDDYKYITVDAVDPLACVYLLDALYLPEIDRLMGVGIEGTAYEMVDGEMVELNIPADASKEVKLKTYVTQWHTTEDRDVDVILGTKYSQGSIPEALQLWAELPTDGYYNNKYVYFTEDEAEIRSKTGADITTYVDEMTMKFITGTEPLDNFDGYLAKLEQIGIQDYIAAHQTAYDRYLAR